MGHLPVPERRHDRKVHFGLDSAPPSADPEGPDREYAVSEIANVGIVDLEDLEVLPRVGEEPLHPCGKAGDALDAAGHSYELKTVGGYRLMPWTWPSRSRDRAEIKKISGQENVPVLVLDDGKVISGSGAIAGWAQANPAG